MRQLIEPRVLSIRGRCHLARSLTCIRGSTPDHTHNYARTNNEGDATTNEYTSLAQYEARVSGYLLVYKKGLR
jgi:hypothetical protein